MGKCTICNSRKGKRKCVVNKSHICSQCCGETRSLDKCEGCSFNKDVTLIRNYRKVPYFPVSQMADMMTLQDQANVIESAISRFDYEQNGSLNDNIVSRIVELLLDKYHFKDDNQVVTSELEEDGFIFVNQAIREDLSSLTGEDLVKLLGTIHRSIHRHNINGREYLDFIHKHVGLRIGKGARLIGRF
jgi:hypothetical protein